MEPLLKFSRNGKIVGEYDLVKLRVMKGEGLLQEGDHVWMQGWTEWKKALAYLDSLPSADPSPSEHQAVSKKRRRRNKKNVEGEENSEEFADAAKPKDRFPWGKTLFIILTVVSVVLKACDPPTKPTIKAARDRQEKLSKAKADKPAASPSSSPAVATKKAAPEQSSYSFTGFGYDGSELFASSALAYAAVIADDTEDEDAPKDAAPFYSEGIAHIGVALSGVKKGERFKVTVSGDRFIKTSKFEFTSETDDSFVEVGPHTILDYEALSRLKQSVPFNVTYTVQRGDEAPKSETQTWIAHQINDCQLYAANYYLTKSGKIKAKPLSSSYSVAGFVNENHPWIDGLLKEAIETRLCDAFDGYQQGDQGVRRQANAIWTALQKRRIVYSNIATTTSSSQGNAYQHVRFIDESLAASQANCIDGSVVIASIFRKIGLNVSIILVPGHAYVAVGKDDDSEYLFALETTLLGSANLDDAIDYATEKGPMSLSKVAEKMSSENDAYQEINLRVARKLGVQPIPYNR